MSKFSKNYKKSFKTHTEHFVKGNKWLAFFVGLVLTFAVRSANAQTTYTWNSSTTVWTTTTAWTPTPTTPATNDILQFTSGTTVTPTAVPTQTIGQLLVSGTNTIVNLQSGGANTLTIGGGTGTDLSVASTCQLNISGSTALIISLSTGATGSITGNMTYSSSTAATVNQLIAADASGITFNSPSVFTQSTNSTGNVFGSGTSNSIVFATGSTYVNAAGSNPFQKTAPASVVVFQTGSLFKANQAAGVGLSISGRTYANLEFNGTGINTITGSGAFSVDNLTVNAGTNSLNLTTGGVSIKGNITVATGASLAFTPASANTLTFNGGTAQGVTNSGTLTFSANEAVVMANSNGVTFNQAQTISGSMTVNSGALIATAATLTLTGTPSISGIFQINQGGWSTGGTWNYNGTGTLNFNNSSGSYGVNGDVFWPSGANAPFNVGFIGAGGGTINSGLGARTIGGTFTLNSTVSVNASSQLTLNGTCLINSGGAITTTAPIYGSSSTLKYNSATTYGRNLEWSATGAGTIGTTAGYPNNVQISNNTTLNLGNGATSTARACNGNLTVDDGSSLSMNVSGSAMTAALTVGGNVTLGSAGTANLTLSGSVGGDLFVKGNWTRNATSTLVNNTRQVTFQGGAAQTLTGNTTFDYFKLNNSAGLTLQASSPITINNQCDMTSGKLTLGANNVTMGSAATFANTSASNYLVTNSTGVLIRSSAIGSKDFPIGPSTSFYTPLIINNTGATNDISAGVGTSITNAVTDNTKIVNLQWSVLSAGAGATANITYQWNTGNHAGSFAVGSTCELGVYTTGPYTTFSAGTPTGSNPYTVTVNSLSLPTTGNNFYVIGNVGSIYASPPTITTPTVSAVTENSALLGANVTSNGGFSITGRGTSYKTSSPVVATDNQAAEGTNTTGVFTMTRSGLSAETPYFFVGYASNSNGTSISAEGSFRTKSNPPIAPATSLSGTPISTSQIDLSWTGATFPGSGATQYGYIIVYSTGTPSLIGSPNGTAPGSAISVGTLLSSAATANPTLPSTTASATGLTTGTSYNFLVVPYTWDGSNASTYNYYTTSPATASAATNAGSPVLSSPTASSITESSAVLGATVTADGGSSLTARGTAYKTSSPVVATDNQAAEGGTTVSSFSHTRSGLSAQTQYFYVGYATNASTTGISSEGSFRTLSNPPTAAATALGGTPVSQSQIDLSWTTASYPSSGATQYGYLVVYSTGTPSLVGSPNGLIPASAISVGTLVSTTATNNPSTPATTASATGLSTNTSYNFLVVPYTWDGTNASTYNYYTSTPATASATTFPNAPTITTTVTATAITNVGASSGGQTLAGTVTSKGVVWNTSANPTLPGLGSTSDGSGTTNFTSTISGLSGQTLYNVRAYASNTGGTGYGTNITLRTKSDPATAQATGLSGSPISTTQIDLSWTGATFPSSGATQGGYLILYSTGTPALVGSPNGLVPASAVSVGTIVSSTATALPSTPAVTASATGLLAGTTYNFLVVPYTWDGANSSTYNYYSPSAPTTSAITNDGTLANDFFRSVATGNWSATATWQSSHNGSTNWISATVTPGTSSNVTIQSPNNVTSDVGATPATVTINSGATLTCSNSGAVGNGSPVTTITVSGTLSVPITCVTAPIVQTTTLTVTSGGVFQNSAGNAAVITVTNFNVNSGGTYNHDAAIPSGGGANANFPGTTRVFGATSNVVVTKWGDGTSSPTGNLPNNFGNLTINIASEGGSWQQGNAITAIQGNITIMATGGGTREFRLAAGGSSALSIGGNVDIQGGIFTQASAAGVITTSITGGFSISGGTFNQDGSTSSPITFVNPGSGNISVTGGTANFGSITIAASRTCNILNSISIPTSRTLTVNGTCNLGASVVVSGAGTFAVSGGVSATLGIASTAGIASSGATGNVQTTTRTFQQDAFYTYNGAANQITGTGLPSAVRLLTINNSGTSGNNIVTLTNAVANQNNSTPIYSVVLAAGKLDLNNKTLTTIGVQSTGGDFTATAGPVSFTASSPSQCTGTINFPTVVMGQGVDFGTASTIVTSLQVNGGNVANVHPPFYATGSTLIYNTSYGVFDEWKAGVSGAAGVPYHVSINSGMTVNLGNNPTARLASGNLTINGSGVLTFGANPNALTVNGDVNITGTGTLTLSTVAGGDIKTGGNWNHTAGATLTTNGRAVFFIGSALQTITRSASGTLNFDYVLNNNSSGGIKQASGTSINITGATNGLQLLGTGSGNNWDLNGNTLTLGTATNIQLSGSQNIISTSGTGTVAVPTSGSSNINSGTSLTFSSAVLVALNGGMDFGSGLSTINGTLQINSGGFVTGNAATYGTGSLLKYNSATTPYVRGIEWATGSGAGYPYNVQISNNTALNPGGTLRTGTTLNVANDLTIDAGSAIYMDYGGNNMTVPLIVNNNVLMNGNLSESGASGGDVIVKGNWTRTGILAPNGRAVFFQGTNAQTMTGTTTFDYVLIDKTGGSFTLGTSSNMLVNQNLTFTGTNVSTITTNANKVSINAGASVTRTGSGHVNGNLQKNVATGTNVARTYEIGDASNYTPVSLNFASVTGAGDVTASTTGAEHPNISTSALNSAKSVNRYWTLANSATAFTTYDATFTFVSGDLDAGVTTANLLVGQYNSGWTYPTTANPLSLSTQGTGISAFGDFTCGECSPVNLVITNQTACAGTVDLTSSGVTTGSTPAGLSFTYWTNIGATSSLSNPTAVSVGGTYYIKASSPAGCYAIQAVTVSIYTSGQWIGGTSTDWATAANWCGGVPTSSTNVSIASGTTFSPIITTGAQLANTITIASGATLEANGGTLTASNDITDNGTLTIGSSGILNLVSNQINGTGSVVINGTLKTSKAAGFSGTTSTAVMNTIGSLTLGSASTVDYSSGGSQTITGGNYANLSNSGDGNRTLSSSGTIGISAALSPGTGNYTITGSTIEYNGTSAQTAAALLPDSKYNNLVINNSAGVGMNADLNLVDALTLTNGALVTTGYNFTLLSSATQTARIAPVTSGSVTGNIVMQRFAAGGNAGWATLGMPVSSATLNEWNDDFVITGINGGTSGSGSFVSIYSYDESATGNANAAASYVAATDVTNTVNPKKGYYVFLGDNATTVSDKLIDVVGPPLIGTQNLNVTFTANTSSSEDGWNLVSNPYCSAIDWLSSNWTKTNMDDAIYIYDADNIQYTGSVGGLTYNGGNEIIASSQAFMVHANAASPVLIATEGVKDAGSPTFYKSSNAANIPGVLRLQLDGLNGTYFDETVFRTVAGASSNFDPSYDAYKLYSLDASAPNISSKLNGVEYVVNAMDELTSNLDLPVRVNVNTPGSYTINFKGLSNFSNVTCFTFEDKLTNTTVDLKVDSSYTFSSGIDTVLAYNRFVLHFGVETIVPSVLPSATTVSIPGNATVNFSNLSSGASSYSWNFGDASPVENTASPSHTYTSAGVYTVTLTASNAAGCSQVTTVTITVDDVTGINHLVASEQVVISKDANGVHASYNFAKNTELRVTIYNALGAQVGETQIAKVQNKGQFDIVSKNLAKGLYTIEVLVEDRKLTKKVEF